MSIVALVLSSILVLIRIVEFGRTQRRRVKLVPEFVVRLVEKAGVSGFQMGIEIKVINKGRPVTIDRFGFTFDKAPPPPLKPRNSDSCFVPVGSLKDVQHELPKRLMKHECTVIFVNTTSLVGGLPKKKPEKETFLEKSWPPARAWVRDVEGYYYECELEKAVREAKPSVVSVVYRP